MTPFFIDASGVCGVALTYYGGFEPVLARGLTSCI
jgi:hypothetical protein